MTPSRWRVLRLVLALVGLAVAAWVVLGRRDELAGASEIIEGLRWPWLSLALVAESLSFVFYAALEHRLLRAGGAAVSLPPLFAVTLAGNAIQNSLPGGAAWAGAYAFGQFRRLGADDVLAGWAMVAVAVLSTVALAALAGVGVLVAGGQGASLGLGGVLAGVVVAAGAAAVALVHRRARRSSVVVRLLTLVFGLSHRLGRRPPGDPGAAAVQVAERVLAVTPRGWVWLAGAGLALANWLLDVVCLVAAFAAVHAVLPWRGLLLAYGAAQLAAALPFTPGGLGVVEGSLAIALVAFGGAEQSTVAGVLLYRLLSFWLPLPVGWSVWATIAWRHRGPRPAEAAA